EGRDRARCSHFLTILAPAAATTASAPPATHGGADRTAGVRLSPARPRARSMRQRAALTPGPSPGVGRGEEAGVASTRFRTGTRRTHQVPPLPTLGEGSGGEGLFQATLLTSYMIPSMIGSRPTNQRRHRGT